MQIVGCCEVEELVFVVDVLMDFVDRFERMDISECDTFKEKLSIVCIVVVLDSKCK